MRIWTMTCFIALAAACGAGRERVNAITTTGTVEFQNVEGGAWLIRTDGGALYRPINLADAFKHVGARVEVTLIERHDIGGIPWPGIPAQVVNISILSSATTGGSGACQPPAAADTSGTDGTGCSPLPKFQDCEQTITPSGTTVQCTDACPATDYAVECRGTTGGASGIPAPDQALRCVVIPIPTPPNELFYCCPCAP